ncbi:Glycine cleavage system protein H [Trichostrongylus colubriformis]|uniref:Glycine cleavage system protein H n=1 Tax=Trichostrongylus colubriformis TaxID=6319 RepID=A0AAN8IFK6_TRICO
MALLVRNLVRLVTHVERVALPLRTFTVTPSIYAVLYSFQAASDIYAPVSGTVTEKNDVLEQEPGKINKSPFEEGWMYKLKLSNTSELSDLLSDKEYQEFKKEDEGHE